MTGWVSHAAERVGTGHCKAALARTAEASAGWIVRAYELQCFYSGNKEFGLWNQLTCDANRFYVQLDCRIRIRSPHRRLPVFFYRQRLRHMSTTSQERSTDRPVEKCETILIAPHQFPDVDREKELAARLGLDIVISADVDEFRAGIPDATLVLVTPYARVTAEDFAAMKRCVAVIRYGIGYDNIDVAAARAAGIPVSIVPGASSEEVASHALTMGLALARRIPAGQASIAAGGWAGKVGLDTPRFSELDVAVIGMGRIGRQVAQWYSALGSNVRAYDPFATFDEVPSGSLDELLEHSHVVSLHLPLADETRNVISADVLARMRKGAVIVNVSRGGLIDENALAEALHSGRIGGAGLDTFSTEPLPADHQLRTAPNLIMTPHVAWRSDRALESLQQAVVDRCTQALTGEPLSDRVA
ncbi:C-terminal binding protein [Rhodococcoides fascians]|uniref:C-terminal binding protein n=1 Tax=Rhodococcoides fascians TaxID=1828 RepID=UPI002786A959|nr:C-terminal binding protein [Rhodococcus fascians]MDQ0283959.1 D-3-phosphoglycerate dehydrogenase [Rhodococcus fascians]